MKAKATSIITFMLIAAQGHVKLCNTLLPKLMSGEVRVDVNNLIGWD